MNSILFFNGVLYSFCLWPLGWVAKFSFDKTHSQILLKGILGVWLTFFVAAVNFFSIACFGLSNKMQWLLINSRIFSPIILAASVLLVIFFFYRKTDTYLSLLIRSRIFYRKLKLYLLSIFYKK